ncbi:hypothetical protein CDAR_166101 [Caerostris darwini]|uniref:Uncharacterized protein n=1 Tax=Caerostris darwini TaxID=1538125 RepID=A0AAV4RUA3_9ARAC|nr:hypothetical protein CDAR_166101 [Caerostris darwini]
MQNWRRKTRWSYKSPKIGESFIDKLFLKDEIVEIIYEISESEEVNVSHQDNHTFIVDKIESLIGETTWVNFSPNRIYTIFTFFTKYLIMGCSGQVTMSDETHGSGC